MTGDLPPVGRGRLVPHETSARAQATAPRIDADRFRADVDAIVDPWPDAGGVGEYADCIA